MQSSRPLPSVVDLKAFDTRKRRVRLLSAAVFVSFCICIFVKSFFFHSGDAMGLHILRCNVG